MERSNEHSIKPRPTGKNLARAYNNREVTSGDVMSDILGKIGYDDETASIILSLPLRRMNGDLVFGADGSQMPIGQYLDWARSDHPEAVGQILNFVALPEGHPMYS